MSGNVSISRLGARVIEIDHLAFAVRDLETSIAWLRDKLGLTLVERRATEGRKTAMVSAVLQLGPLCFVVVQGTSNESQVSRFVGHYGTGVHHVAIRVEGLPGIVSELREGGNEFGTNIIDNGSYRQAFMKRDRHTGIMFELIERFEGKAFQDGGVRQLFEELEASESY